LEDTEGHPGLEDGGRLEAPADAVLDRLGRVGLGEDLPPEQPEEVLVVIEPLGGVVWLPALVPVECFPEVGRVRPNGISAAAEHETLDEIRTAREATITGVSQTTATFGG